MKKVGLFFCIPLFIMAAPVKYASIADTQNCIFVISEPRSGVNWLTCCLQSLTRRSLCRDKFAFDLSLNNRMKQTLDHTKEPFIRTHNPTIAQTADPEKNQLILIFRDYKENTIRRRGNLSYKKLLQKGTLFDHQAKILDCFDKWPEENRYLVFYEELLLNPRKTLKAVLEFLGESEERLEEFLENIEQYKNICLASYDEDKKKEPLFGAISRGLDLRYHSKTVAPELLLKADALFKKKYPCLWYKYLSHYEEAVEQRLNKRGIK